ncbi:lipopolysaccharide-binding protein-like [Sturnira hondurensis]|uniref:lipopolysaccharide-binding protein-like n=1 Tax=Sturnira hondurensis TaxID=192404 RepID=UPI001879BB78|nr:lipopolysaccharide-binding protein-like [Sturnira hondurensis]
MARPYCVVVALLLLAGVSRLGEGASNPGFVARITREGLEYARQYGKAALEKELSTINLPDLSGSFHAGLIGSVSYEFRSLRIRDFQLRNFNLSLRPEQGIMASLSDNYMSVSGNWMVKKAFITLHGSFDLSADGVSISVSVKLGKDQSGRPTASVTHCSNSVGHFSIDISGSLSWLLNLFHESIENNFKSISEQKICEMVVELTTSHLKPYLRTLPVTLKIDQVAFVDYRLVGAPQVTSQGMDVPFKGKFFGLSRHDRVSFDIPPIRMPQEHDLMIYFAVSEYVFNTASWVYHQAGHMNFTIRNEHIQNLMRFVGNPSAKAWRKPSCLTSKDIPFTTMISCFSSSFLLRLLQRPLDSPVHLHTTSLGAVIPQLPRLYPNMELELEVSPESAPFLTFTPGNVTLVPVINIQAFALLPDSSDRKLLFQLRAGTNISATISVSSNRIWGSLTPGSKLKLELIQSNINFFNVQLMESVLNYYATYLIYPSLNAKLAEGFPLPLPRNTFLNDLQLQIHKNFLLVGANME